MLYLCTQSIFYFKDFCLSPQFSSSKLCCLNFFYSLLTLLQDKLERLSLAHVYRLNNIFKQGRSLQEWSIFTVFHSMGRLTHKC